MYVCGGGDNNNMALSPEVLECKLMLANTPPDWVFRRINTALLEHYRDYPTAEDGYIYLSLDKLLPEHLCPRTVRYTKELQNYMQEAAWSYRSEGWHVEYSPGLAKWKFKPKNYKF